MPADDEPPEDPTAGLFYAAEHGRTDILKMCIKLLLQEQNGNTDGSSRRTSSSERAQDEEITKQILSSLT